jgi:hypothetical protein
MIDPIRPFFDSLAGKRIPGGCPDCDAEQQLEEVAPGMWQLVIGHDTRCPFYRAEVARRGVN